MTAPVCPRCGKAALAPNGVAGTAAEWRCPCCGFVCVGRDGTELRQVFRNWDGE